MNLAWQSLHWSPTGKMFFNSKSGPGSSISVSSVVDLISTGWILICDTACSRRSGVPFSSFPASMLVSLRDSWVSNWSRTSISVSILTSWISLGSFVSSTERKNNYLITKGFSHNMMQTRYLFAKIIKSLESFKNNSFQTSFLSSLPEIKYFFQINT